MPVLALRAHHGLCLLSWQGKGYSPAFTAEMDRVAALLAAAPQTEIRLLAAPDGLCARCPNLRGAACSSSRPAQYDRAVLAALGLEAGAVLPWGRLRARTRELARTSLPAICGGCQWFSICSGNKF